MVSCHCPRPEGTRHIQEDVTKKTVNIKDSEEKKKKKSTAKED